MSRVILAAGCKCTIDNLARCSNEELLRDMAPWLVGPIKRKQTPSLSNRPVPLQPWNPASESDENYWLPATLRSFIDGLPWNGADDSYCNCALVDEPVCGADGQTSV